MCILRLDQMCWTDVHLLSVRVRAENTESLVITSREENYSQVSHSCPYPIYASTPWHIPVYVSKF